MGRRTGPPALAPLCQRNRFLPEGCSSVLRAARDRGRRLTSRRQSSLDSIVGPAKVYVGVNGYAASSAYNLKITYKEGTGTTPPAPPPAELAWINTQGAVTQGEMKVFTMDVIAGKKIFVRTTAAADVDLYIMMGTAPTTSAYTMRAWTSSGNETISSSSERTGRDSSSDCSLAVSRPA